MFNGLGFKAKLLLLCGFFCAVNLTIGVTSFLGLQRVTKEYDRVTEVSLPSVIHLNEMFLQYRGVRISLRSLGLPGLSHQQEADYVTEVKAAIAAYEKAEASYLAGHFIAGEKELYERVGADWKTFTQVGMRVLALHEKGTPEARAQMVDIFLKDCPVAAADYLEAITKLKAFHMEHAKDYVMTAQSTRDFTNILSLIIVIGGAFSGLLLGYVFSKNIAGTIKKIVDLLRVNATQVSQASAQIASASQELSQAATQQAASLEETAAALEELNSMVAKNRDSAKSTADVSNESESSATKGHSTVDQMIRSMDEITQSNDQISEIVQVITEIGNKTKVINDIVFQTKLLSFNASVEAARAGEQGKGFAVVAQEVGNLAQMSGNAAKEISTLLASSVHRVEVIVNQTREKVGSGSAWTQECGGILEEIVENVSRVSGMANEISLASEEQSRGVQEISKAMTQLDQMTQQNASTSEKCAIAAEQLSQQSQTLSETVDQLTVIMTGQKSA